MDSFEDKLLAIGIKVVRASYCKKCCLCGYCSKGEEGMEPTCRSHFGSNVHLEASADDWAFLVIVIRLFVDEGRVLRAVKGIHQ